MSIMSILRNKTIKEYLYKSIPPFILSYIIYKRYNLSKNKTNNKPPLEYKKYERSIINYKYDSIRLSHGNVHYRTNIINPHSLMKIDNKYDTQIYLFIHSENGSMDEFNNIISNLNDINRYNSQQPKINDPINFNDKSIKYYYILVDLYGYGYSQYDNTPQTIQLYISQISELLYSLNITCKINIVGYSMGAAISAGYSATYPSKIKSLILLSPNGYKGFRENNTPWYMKYINNTHILTLLSIYNVNFYNKNDLTYLKQWDNIKSKEFIEYYNNNDTYYNNIDITNTIYEKVLSNVSYIRNFPIGEIDYIYKHINNKIKNILVIWGENDDTNKTQNRININNILYNSHIINYSNYKQFYPLEHGDIVNNDIIKWNIENIRQEKYDKNNKDD